MQDENRTPREAQLERLVLALADKVAVMLAYVSAIEDAVDPFFDADVEKSWIVAGLAQGAKRQVFNGCRGSEPWGVDTKLAIRAARANKQIDIRETDLYSQCRVSVSGLVKQLGADIAA